MPSCTRKTKKEIRKRIKHNNKNIDIEKLDLMQDLEEIEKKRIYTKGKQGYFGDTVEIDACEHLWINDWTFHIYKTIDAFRGKILAIYVEKEGNY